MKYKDNHLHFDREYDMLEPVWEMFHGTCRYCGVDTYETEEYYMVTDEVWSTVNVDSEGEAISFGMLCIGCVESRLGRQLTRKDFTDAPVNTDDKDKRSARLKDRLAS